MLMNFGLLKAAEIRNVFALAGTATSVGGYYYLLKATDPYCQYEHKLTSEEKFDLVPTAAVLKGISLALVAPKLALSNYRLLRFTLHESGSFFMGMGLCQLEIAYKKYEKYKKNEHLMVFPDRLKDEALNDCVLGALLMGLGSVGLSGLYIDEGECVP